MTMFRIDSEHCWLCGNTQANSKHHAIPTTLHPKHNVVIPICEECHKKINEIDTGALNSYTYRILKRVEEQLVAIKSVRGILNKNGKD